MDGIEEQLMHFEENAAIEKKELQKTIISLKQQKEEMYNNAYWDASKEFSDKFDMQKEFY